MDPCQTRLIGDYVLEQRIGSGSFAVVWRARYQQRGDVVAVKEIDKKLLSPKVKENLLKEISILSNIDHPNIIRFFEAIETKDRIFLVLEYCDGGDLGAYILRHGKVSEAVAKHFMRQLAAGLQVLQERHLIHRDLKPQNLLLSSNEAIPHLKIGDFGFARSLTPQNLADTLCGSPLYMAPEIIQSQKYDAKADLWSVGAILFQLVTGKPPFDGSSQYQLFQNILSSTELRFPQGALEELHPDCVDLCRSLLRQNPVERLAFKEFFDHNFLREARPMVDVQQPFFLQMKSVAEQVDSSICEKMPALHSGHPMNVSSRNPRSCCSFMLDNVVLQGKDHGGASSSKGVNEPMPNIVSDKMRKSVDGEQCSSDLPRVSDSMELIEKEYVLVNANFASMESFCDLESSLQVISTTKGSICPSKKSDENITVAMQAIELGAAFTGYVESSQLHRSDPLTTSCPSTILHEVQGSPILHPPTRLRLLHQYVQALAELAQEKHKAGLFLESFSVELVILAIWKKAFQICSSWSNSAAGSELPGSSSANESTIVKGESSSSPNTENKEDFDRPSSACMWVERSFLIAFDRAEKLSYHIQDMDAAAEMPDAMEIIFQKALAMGTSGAVDEYMENKGRAATLYSKAMLLLSFIIEEATSLPLNPPFLLTPANKKRVQRYIIDLQYHHESQFLPPQPFQKQSLGSLPE